MTKIWWNTLVIVKKTSSRLNLIPAWQRKLYPPWKFTASYSTFRYLLWNRISTLHSTSGALSFLFVNIASFIGLQLRLGSGLVLALRLVLHYQTVKYQNNGSISGRPFVKRFPLCYRAVVCPVCNVGVLWPDGWMHKDATWYGGRPWPRPHC